MNPEKISEYALGIITVFPERFDNSKTHNGDVHSYAGHIDILLGAVNTVDRFENDVKGALGVTDYQWQNLCGASSAKELYILHSRYFTRGGYSADGYDAEGRNIYGYKGI